MTPELLHDWQIVWYEYRLANETRPEAIKFILETLKNLIPNQ